MKIVSKFPIAKNIKLYRTIQNIVNPKLIKDAQYLDDTLSGVKIRIFDPKKSSKLIIYIHGGGWVSGNIDTHSNICLKLAEVLNRKVIAIDYRLAPEFPYPAGFLDCYEVIKTIMDNIASFGITWDDVIIMGDSAGANLTFAVSLKGFYEKTFRTGKLILIYPATQTDYTLSSKYHSLFTNDSKGFLSRKNLEDYINMYIPDVTRRNDIYVNLLKAKHLFGLPKTLIITGTEDPLHDEGLALAQKLKRHLVSVKHYDIKGAPHGYFNNILDKKYTKIAIKYIKEFVGDNIE